MIPKVLLRTATADLRALHRNKCRGSFELLSSAGFKKAQSQGKEKNQPLYEGKTQDTRTGQEGEGGNVDLGMR